MARILIADDDANLRMILRDMLQQAGHHVGEASNGQEAIDFTHSEQVDLVITDIIMPDKEGIETIIEIRKSHPDVKIIAASGGGRCSAEDYLEAADAFGADRTLMKPFGRDELLSAVEDLLRSRSASQRQHERASKRFGQV